MIPQPANRKLTVLIALGFVALTSSCGGSLYKVRPAVELPPMSGVATTASGGGITFRVAPLLSDEDSQELFEANLPLSGVLPIRIALDYEGSAPVELKRARFQLHDGQGGEWKLLSPKQAISRILKANGIFAYNPNSRKQFEQDLMAYGLDLKTPLTSDARSRQGFLFFATPDKRPVESPRGLTLEVERVPQPVKLTLN